MTIISFKYTKSAVNRAGSKLLDTTSIDSVEAKCILDNWRACHIAPLNSFQKSLRLNLKKIDAQAWVSQRLKRTPSILSKLKRHPKMMLARMQDIGGIRAVVQNMKRVREIEAEYKKGTKVFTVINGGKDYINYPKTSGYRSVHIVFKYNNGVSIELQIRTQIQHAWATAVETMGTFLEHSLKSSEGPEEWLDFFSLASSAFAILESTPRISGFDKLSDQETFEKLLQTAERLDVLSKLAGFRVAARHIKDDKKKGHYHLITLDLDESKVYIQSYERKDVNLANIEYSRKESEINEGKNMQVVLVSSESVKALKKSYPSYFLDADLFAKQIISVEKKLAKLSNK
ncbi:MAG: (p)ppGpp synthetase [Gammaproteobacteria bacterium]|nr:MAG: (p)ppGpp synthetase [Gammaproteobacteria bacterium]